MESTGVPGCIHVSQATFDLLPHSFPQEGHQQQDAAVGVLGGLDVDPRWKCTGGVEAKGKGVMQTWLWKEQGH